ncbi:catalase [Chitinophaga nivalis]|uniref:Catalase n=1 Tax=Chitinophaga nivalis TaxID=2991709 RepID=A0ABT3IWC9_9BACT|nr:catalase [Chitinophaga nivalis]MCW3462012.1 catalase [Chitinophaga nivalis]MCW3488296.1 catalase [Chitinophaga nivalis]
MAKKKVTIPDNEKQQELERDKEHPEDTLLTTNQGLKINDNQNSLKAGERGPSLLEDFILREKITHFDHERIPERIVHARGAGAHGIFQLYASQEKYTKAKFLNDTNTATPVFVRFSTVAGSRGSSDLARDARGFAVKFYTEEGNYDLVGNNIPVFFIQDAMKFPDLIHAVKPEPHHEMPQAASAHDTFWDFISLMPEAAHMIMWVMSDRAIPRSYRMMEGFGVNTFRLINEKGEAHFVKFHWKPVLGAHAVAWDEALKISGKDPDFHRRDLWEAIENKQYPEWELGIQIVAAADEHTLGIDLLDPTKLIPEEQVPVEMIGKLTLNRNPDNFFAETEQVAFHPGHIVPGIDFTNDPLLQGRLFSYTDTQLSRLGSPNFHEIPINRAISAVHNNQRDGHMRQTINTGRTSYQPNTIGGGCPFQAKLSEGGFTSYEERIDAHKIRDRSESFSDHFSQAKLFYNSQSTAEKKHLTDALRFELGKVEITAIKTRMLGILSQIDRLLAENVAAGLGLEVPEQPEKPINQGIPADADPEKYEPTPIHLIIESSAALSMDRKENKGIVSRKVAFLVADGVDGQSLEDARDALLDEGAVVKVIAPHGGFIRNADGEDIPVDHTLLTTASVLFDALYIPGGAASIAALKQDPDAIHFINETFRHCKAIAAHPDAHALINVTYVASHADKNKDSGLYLDDDMEAFIAGIGLHRFWDLEEERKVPA